jgi:hypothetical protein
MDNLDDAIIKEMKNESLRYIPDSTAGYFRQKNRNTFSYYDTDGNKIKDEATLEPYQ